MHDDGFPMHRTKLSLAFVKFFASICSSPYTWLQSSIPKSVTKSKSSFTAMTNKESFNICIINCLLFFFLHMQHAYCFKSDFHKISISFFIKKIERLALVIVATCLHNLAHFGNLTNL